VHAQLSKLKKKQIRNVNPFDMDKSVHNKAYSCTLAHNIYRKKCRNAKREEVLEKDSTQKKIVVAKHELYHHILKYLS
jgi:hypothetical protein